MCQTNQRIIAALMTGTLLLAGADLFAQPAPTASKLELTPQSLSKVHALIRPQEHEWRHLRIHWLTDPVAALKKASAEDKPLVYLYLGGAGYNAPLGIC